MSRDVHFEVFFSIKINLPNELVLNLAIYEAFFNTRIMKATIENIIRHLHVVIRTGIFSIDKLFFTWKYEMTQDKNRM